MAIPQRTINGSVLLPTGAGAPGGTIKATLSSRSGKVADDVSGDGSVIGGELDAVVADDGTVSFNLTPNDEITPAGTYWILEFRLADGSRWKRWVTVPSGAGAIAIGDLPEAIPIQTSTVRYLVASYVTDPDENLPAADAGYRRVVAYVDGPASDEDVVFVCMKTAGDTYDWVVDTVGGL